MKNNSVLITVAIMVVLLSIAGVALYFYTRPATTAPSTTQGDFGQVFPSGGERTVSEAERIVLKKKSTANTDDINANLSTTAGGKSGAFEYRQLTRKATGGATTFELNGKSIVRYIEKGTGHIYEIEPQGLTATKITNTTVPRIFDSVWGSPIPPSGKFTATSTPLVARYLEGKFNMVKTLLADIITSTSTSPAEMSGTIMPDTVSASAVSPDGKNIFYLNVSSDGANGIISDFHNTRQRHAFSSLVSEWQVIWPATETIQFTTKPASGVPGFLYWLNVKTEKFEKKMGDTKGLTALTSPDLTSIVYSENSNNRISTFLYDVASRESSLFPLTTLPEKCVWGKSQSAYIYCAIPSAIPPASYPDTWYQGRISFSDKIYKIETFDGNFDLIFDPQDARVLDGIDAINLFLDSKENYLYFTNKKDGTLWSVKIK